ncbi:uncharacterized protein LOC125944764 [Dermacentor silvarum]|uniref:uncharacterized protein LOC125944764 n=1 Tax=Dermacentor silvarum TaxID=543639 RepID=UPI002101C035|nr:uncharacterized protein LOC125944764 [Dermacentor silvarum]
MAVVVIGDQYDDPFGYYGVQTVSDKDNMEGRRTGGAGYWLGDIYGIAMAPGVDTTVTRPDLVSGGTKYAKCNQCSCKITWELTNYGKGGSCKKQFEFTCTCNSYRCDKKETQFCMAKLVSPM